jgi:hypothetical protein
MNDRPEPLTGRGHPMPQRPQRGMLEGNTPGKIVFTR